MKRCNIIEHRERSRSCYYFLCRSLLGTNCAANIVLQHEILTVVSTIFVAMQLLSYYFYPIISFTEKKLAYPLGKKVAERSKKKKKHLPQLTPIYPY